jgi:hypothetical protein
MDPRLQALSDTLGLPGADEPLKPIKIQRKILADFPTPEYSRELLEAFCEYVSPLFNIIHEVIPSFLLLLI